MIVAATLAVALLIVLYLHITKYDANLSKDCDKAPGPSPHWLLGNILDLKRHAESSGQHPDLLFQSIVREHGPVSRLKIPIYGNDLVIVSDPNVYKEIVHTNPQPKPDVLYWCLSFALGPKSMLVSDDAMHHHQRKAFNPGFSSGFLRSCVPSFKERIRVFCDDLRQAAEQEKVVNVHDMAVKLTCEVIMKVAFNTAIDVQGADAEAHEIYLNLKELMNTASYYSDKPHLRWQLLLPWNARKIKQLRHEIDTFLYAVIEERIDALSEVVGCEGDTATELVPIYVPKQGSGKRMSRQPSMEMSSEFLSQLVDKITYGSLPSSPQPRRRSFQPLNESTVAGRMRGSSFGSSISIYQEHTLLKNMPESLVEERPSRAHSRETTPLTVRKRLGELKKRASFNSMNLNYSSPSGVGEFSDQSNLDRETYTTGSVRLTPTTCGPPQTRFGSIQLLGVGMRRSLGKTTEAPEVLVHMSSDSLSQATLHRDAPRLPATRWYTPTSALAQSSECLSTNLGHSKGKRMFSELERPTPYSGSSTFSRGVSGSFDSLVNHQHHPVNPKYGSTVRRNSLKMRPSAKDVNAEQSGVTLRQARTEGSTSSLNSPTSRECGLQSPSYRQATEQAIRASSCEVLSAASNKLKNEVGADVLSDGNESEPSTEKLQQLIKQRKDILSIALSYTMENGNGESVDLDMESIVSQMKTFMFAGHDTVAATTAWCLRLLGENKDIQEKLITEVDELYATKPNFEFRDLDKLQMVDAVMKETLRLYPPASTLRHVAPGTAPIKGYDLADSLCFVSAYTMHRDEKIWGEDADKFDPTRWFDGRQTKVNRWAYIPFSNGPRNCIGQQFAKIELKYIIAMTFREFRFMPVGEESIAFHITTVPKNGCKLLPLRRKDVRQFDLNTGKAGSQVSGGAE